MIAEAFLVCALAVPSLSSEHVALTQTDVSFFRFLEEMVPDYEVVKGETKYKMVVVNEPVDHWNTLTKYADQVIPGGFLVVNVQKAGLRRWLLDQGWEILPFYWKDKAIYRRFYGGVRELRKDGA